MSKALAMTEPILPGATIGIFGSGQLGRMMTFAAKRMGYRVNTFSPEADSPTGQVADREFVAGYNDSACVRDFIRSVDVVTFEFENVDSSVADVAVELGVPVRPSGHVLRIAQNRIREKSTLRDAGLPVTPFLPILSAADMAAAVRQLGFPMVLKTASSGYDGKGQTVARKAEDLTQSWEKMGRPACVAEQWIEFEKEVSVVAARGLDGTYADYGVIENLHRNHILDLSISPGRTSVETAKEAQYLAERALTALAVVGVTCVEYFVKQDGSLLINEIAPRPHNSGHLTIEAADTSQFEQHIRAVCNLPLGSTYCARPSAMANLLGDLWSGGTPPWQEAFSFTDVKLHLYGKREPRPGRKMGHLTAVSRPPSPPSGADVQSVVDRVLTAREALATGDASTTAGIVSGHAGSSDHVPRLDLV